MLDLSMWQPFPSLYILIIIFVSHNAKKVLNIYLNSDNSSAHAQPLTGPRPLSLYLGLLLSLYVAYANGESSALCAVSAEPLLLAYMPGIFFCVTRLSYDNNTAADSK